MTQAYQPDQFNSHAAVIPTSTIPSAVATITTAPPSYSYLLSQLEAFSYTCDTNQNNQNNRIRENSKSKATLDVFEPAYDEIYLNNLSYLICLFVD